VAAPIHHEVDFKASPKRVYEALTDAKQFSAFSGLPAEIHGEARGSFKCFDGQITGRMTELVPSQKIVQAWHVAMWPDDVNSMVRFELTKGYLLNHRGTNGVSCIVVRVTGSGPTVRSETILLGRFASTPKAQRHCYKTISTRPN